MQINVTTDYAIRAVLYLAIQNKVTTSNDIASAMGIPNSYILKITNKLLASRYSKKSRRSKRRLFIRQKNGRNKHV